MDIRLDYDTLRKEGLTLGSGAVIVAGSRGATRHALIRSILEFFRHESCGKCVPLPGGHAPVWRRRRRTLAAAEPGEAPRHPGSDGRGGPAHGRDLPLSPGTVADPAPGLRGPGTSGGLCMNEARDGPLHAWTAARPRRRRRSNLLGGPACRGRRGARASAGTAKLSAHRGLQALRCQDRRPAWARKPPARPSWRRA
ncbi:MAG: hypothetical protein M0C28_30035 [Candidatus Moduliflexus flocculans]|nr:hypothetical protein [Candidatus Moduliflexus flocculans]